MRRASALGRAGFPRTLAARALALALALTAGSVGCSSRTTATRSRPRSQPVSLSLPTLGGGRVDLAGERGHPVVLFMFTTWSLRAQAEATRFVQLADQHGKRGLRVIGVALDRHARPLVKAYVSYLHMRFPVAVAQPNDPALVDAIGATRSVPRSVLLDRAGRVVLDFKGATDFKKLTGAIEKLLGSAPGQ